jgi:hypothetical protein
VGEKIPDAPKQAMSEGAFYLEFPVNQLKGYKTTVHLEIWASGKLIDKTKTSFLGPLK